MQRLEGLVLLNFLIQRYWWKTNEILILTCSMEVASVGTADIPRVLVDTAGEEVVGAL